ncbi:MAG: hypothetical protein PWP56_2093 [Acetobacterium sp.]|jgi:hypothetical protein|nr:hypothetical protein [Eubacteriaceae bacterium]MDK2904396.1 hypothetical protein [Eubacteriaceae bacterium]MDK2942580.1 hypothetical protein [Acetobacterium sp.]
MLQTYDGKLTIDTDYEKNEFIAFLNESCFMLQRIDTQEIRTKEDLNSLTILLMRSNLISVITREIESLSDVARILNDNLSSDAGRQLSL